MPRCLLWFVFLLLLIPGAVKAQTGDWNRVLDQYEEICDRCIVLRQSLDAGGKVPQQSFLDLLAQMRSLWSQIQGAKGGMTRSQQTRFDTIRRKYESVMSGSSSSSTEPRQKERVALAIPEEKTLKAGERNSAPSEVKVESPQQIPLPDDRTQEVLLMDSLLNSALRIEHTVDTIVMRDTVFISNEIIHKYKPSAQGSFYVLAQLQTGNMPSYGLMVAYTPGNVGGYMSIRTNFRFSGFNYEVSSSGDYRNGSFFWGNESSVSRHSIHSLNLGPVLRLGSNLMVYAGAGYGNRKLLWRDMRGVWAKVKEYSYSGFGFEAGAVGSYKRFCLGLGMSHFKETDVVISLGVNL